MNPSGAVLLGREEPLPAWWHHPAHLQLDAATGPDALVRVDHPLFGPLYSGIPELGWEGDRRLQMYLDPRMNRFLLVRLERDERYRVVCTSPYGKQMTAEACVGLIRHLMDSDPRRGFHPHHSLTARNDQVRAAAKAKIDDRLENEVIPKLRWALLSKDRAADYC